MVKFFFDRLTNVTFLGSYCEHDQGKEIEIYDKTAKNIFAFKPTY